MPPDTSLYLHIPFCAHRCAYCDFNTYAGHNDLIPAYVNAIINEIRFVHKPLLPARTIFFGGGTPSLLSVDQIDSILSALRESFDVADDAEISMEANPGTLDRDQLIGLRRIGINRLSFGVQSANPIELRMLERIHDYKDVIHAVSWSRQADFDNLNLDLIYGLPEQTLASWQNTLKLIVDLHPEHLSLYALTLEHGTPFGRWSQRGLLPMPDPDLAAEMYEWSAEYLSAQGYTQYEISNWAKEQGLGIGDQSSVIRPPSTFNVQPATFQPSFACKHNLQYWRGLPYLGFGAGAHGYADGIRYSNVLRIKTYIERCTSRPSSPHLLFPLSPASVNHHKNSRREDMQEMMMTGLRLVIEGVSDQAFKDRFSVGIAEAFPKEVDELLKLNLVEWVEYQVSGVRCQVLRLTPHARLLGNQVFMRFVGE
jgi:oxygen-independent coproporphyrinogen-3 oxidase